MLTAPRIFAALTIVVYASWIGPVQDCRADPTPPPSTLAAADPPPKITYGTEEGRLTVTGKKEGKPANTRPVSPASPASKPMHPDCVVQADGVVCNDGRSILDMSGLSSPGAAAQHVVASMELRFPEIGIVPEPGPTSVGLVGVQNWMWVNNPEIFSTVSDSAAIGAWVIAVSGRVAWVDWDMGDGQVIRCTGPGTPYEDRYGLRRSPDCGHVYSVQGDYTVTATAHWVLHWSGGNESGTLTADQTASVPITIGEAFAVRRK